MSEVLSNRKIIGTLSDVRLEQALLGCLINRPGMALTLPGFFDSTHYAHPMHEMIHNVVRDRGVPGSSALHIVFDALAGREGCGHPYIMGLVDASAAYGPEVVNQLAELVTDRHRRRSMIEICAQMQAGAERGDIPADVTMAQAQARLDLLWSAGNRQRRDLVSWDDAVDQALAEADRAASLGGRITGVSTGMALVDDALGGLEPKSLLILAGRPGSGKSAMLVKWLAGAARQSLAQAADEGGKPGVVALFSIEMRALALARRFLAAQSGVSGRAIRRGEHEPYAERLIKARDQILGLPIVIDEMTGQTLSMIRASLRRLKQKHGRIHAIGVDHLHIMREEVGEAGRRNETWTIGTFSRGLKEIAGEYDCPVLAAAQLSRANVLRVAEEQRPRLTDLRQSGNIEQDADYVCFVYRHEMHLPKQPPDTATGRSQEQCQRELDAYYRERERWAGVAEFIVAKAREEEADKTIRMRWDGPTTNFTEETNDVTHPHG